MEQTLWLGLLGSDDAMRISFGELQRRIEEVTEKAGICDIGELVVVVDSAPGWEGLLPLAVAAAQWLTARLLVFAEPSAAGTGRLEEVQQQLMQCDYRTLPSGSRCMELPSDGAISLVGSETASVIRLVLRRGTASAHPEAAV